MGIRKNHTMCYDVAQCNTNSIKGDEMKYLLPILSIFMMSCDPDCPLGAESCNRIETNHPELCWYGDFTNRTTINCEPCEDFFDRIAEADEEWEDGSFLIGCANAIDESLCYYNETNYEDCEIGCDYHENRLSNTYDECIVVD